MFEGKLNGLILPSYRHPQIFFLKQVKWKIHAYSLDKKYWFQAVHIYRILSHQFQPDQIDIDFACVVGYGYRLSLHKSNSFLPTGWKPFDHTVWPPLRKVEHWCKFAFIIFEVVQFKQTKHYMHQKLNQFYGRYFYPLPMMPPNKTFRHIDLFLFNKRREKKKKKRNAIVYSSFMLSVDQ